MDTIKIKVLRKILFDRVILCTQQKYCNNKN